ncbi:zinc transport system substrate-binding protein [Lipingzhangella halophila]|uniref:Zinc transport system substrate-binding protein n=1 Tax=Lipingzhangella halophila TaxID=1783352 RepID=A0A7W7W1Y0_9ACTN|nr:metal ABC transporter substrate-binding protein [Lipingzhangella halophila]MBB4930120.1 zinc transport system substrate-binding protein [Lipingzhangella halophila]
MRSSMSVRMTAACAASVLAVTASGCGEETSEGGGAGASVVTGVYPLEWLATQVGGEHADVDNLTEPGVDPHALELSPRQVGQVSEADVAFYVSGLQPAVDDAIDQEGGENALDVADLVELRPAGEEEDGHGEDGEHEEHGEEHGEEDGHGEDGEHDEHGEEDPHMWLDLDRMSQATEGLAEQLAEVDPDNAADYRANAETTIDTLTGIDQEYADTLDACESRDIVVNHAAFGYLAESYDLNQISISGLESDSEPSPARIAEVADLVEEHDVTTVFTETLTPTDTAETIAEETGAETAVLDPLGGITDESPGDDYPSGMRANLDALDSALRCS